MSGCGVRYGTGPWTQPSDKQRVFPVQTFEFLEVGILSLARPLRNRHPDFAAY